MTDDQFAVSNREREALEDAHFWGKCSSNCKHDYYVDLVGRKWEAQPLELRVLGQERAKRVLKRVQSSVFDQMTHELVQEEARQVIWQARRATMTPEELAADDERIKENELASREYLQRVILASQPDN